MRRARARDRAQRRGEGSAGSQCSCRCAQACSRRARCGGIGGEARRSRGGRRRRRGRCGGSELQRSAPVEAADDGGPRGHSGAARWAQWPWLGRSHGGGGARMRWGRRERRGSEGRGRGVVTEGESRVSGRRNRGGGGVATLSSPVAGEGGAAGTCPCSDPGRGNREGEGTVERGGPGRLGLGSAQLGQGPVGGRGVPFLVCFLFLFVLFSLYLFIFFSVLIHLKAFRHFIKM